MPDENELRAAALKTASSILQKRTEAEEEMQAARKALEQRTQELGYALAAIQATLESTTDGILAADSHHKITHFNTRFRSMWGLEESLPASGDLQGVVEAMSERLKEPSTFLSRFKSIKETDEESYDFLTLVDERFFEQYSRIMRVEGRPSGRVWSFRDVTSRHKSDIDSRRLAEIVASSDDAIISKDLNGNITSWNTAAERIFGYTASEIINQSITILIPEERHQEEREILRRLRQGLKVDHFETVRLDKEGRSLDISLTVSPIKNSDGVIIGASKIARNITDKKRQEKAIQRQKEKLAIVNAIGVTLGEQMDLETLVQMVTDAGRDLSGAAFGAFFYTSKNESGEFLSLYTLSGAPREAFEKFGMPRNTPIFGPTFHGEGVVRIGDVLQDPRYGQMPPHHGLPKGHLSVRSYLAVPVVSRSGEVLGGLFFGHPEPDVFTSDSEELLLAIAAHAAVAIDNSRLYAVLEDELQQQQVTQHALRESEAFSRSILDSTADCIKVLDAEGRLLSMNPPGLALFEVKQLDEILGKYWVDLWPAKMQEVVSAAIKAAKEGGLSRFQGPCSTASGVRKWWDVIVSPLRDAEGEVTRLTATSRDMTELRRVEEEMQEAHHEAQRQSRIKDEFLATLSHELRTPLQSILGWTQILRDPDCDSADLAQGLEVIDRNAAAQTRIIEDLLDMNRILSGKVRLDVQKLNLATVVEDSVESVRPAALAKDIRLHAMIDPLAKHVSGDPNRLQQIFWNLLSNAIKFTPRKGRVQVTLERVNSHLEVSVSDTGEGIAPEFLPYVFERFRQADATTTRKHAGLGLGLAIVKHLTELHGGTVRAKSAGPSQGSTFIVCLPLAPVYVDPDDHARHPYTPSEGSTDVPNPVVKGVSVLVVDDEPDARAIIGRTLSRAGADVRMAGSCEEALDMIQADMPDVVVSDIGMPGQDGYALIRTIRSLPPEKGGRIPAIALTAYTRPEDRIKAIAAGFQMHLAKPADGLELLTLVESLSGMRIVADPETSPDTAE